MKATQVPINRGMEWMRNVWDISFSIVEHYSANKRMKFCHLQQSE